jgi:hypothetical protein
MGILAPLRHRFFFFKIDLVSEHARSPNNFSFFERDATWLSNVLLTYLEMKNNE